MFAATTVMQLPNNYADHSTSFLTYFLQLLNFCRLLRHDTPRLDQV